MADTTLTFTSLTSQTPVELVDDPSAPGWGEDFDSSKRDSYAEIQLSSDSIVVVVTEGQSRPDETDHLLRSKENAAHLKRSIEQHRNGKVFARPSVRE